LRQPHGTPLTPDINNLPPGGNPIGTPTVKVDYIIQKQQHKQQQQQQQTKQQTIAKPSQNLSGLGFDWLQFLMRSGRGTNEVRTRSEIKFWETDPLSLLTNSLVTTRFRIVFKTV